ncbi:hypothetical protein H310_06927 [Aphanomyces invadans]|uniref:HTH CENPB-type domain-containing protein n=1 Tax=Aphanomyces invadans TaxID=157072 RepID=A0A024U672_9STRA|nr:hypothetical protein H310_06927 [Aphanomyces invadans]ETW01377.1 hypothetical protein H310_06927 [Aphanomyces invadans]|eukprot:XP_008870375.1 hypothetical protein H310_06927 [Aphanomyces invadans]
MSIPYHTLKHYLNLHRRGITIKSSRMGPPPTLPLECEQNMVQWIVAMQKVGYPITRQDLLLKANGLQADANYVPAGTDVLCWHLDFSLVKLNLKAGVSLAPYGYLQARSTGPVLNESIYIAQHPVGKPKRIATTVDSGVASTIETLSATTYRSDQGRYSLDTDVGSFGSSVRGARDNKVVALRNCGSWPNSGIKINKIVSKLRSVGTCLRTPLPRTMVRRAECDV